MENDIVCTFAFFHSISSNREATKVLGVDKRNIKKGYEKCVTDDDGMN
jgi:hypothetical protein